MPALYEKIKKQYIAKGKSEDKAQEIAARIYNKVRSKKKSLPKLSNKPD